MNDHMCHPPPASFLFSLLFCSLLSFFFLQACKIDSLRSKVDLLRLPLALSSKSFSDRKSQLSTVWENGGGGSGVGQARKYRPAPASDMDNESTYSGYSYKSSHSRSNRKHRLVGLNTESQRIGGQLIAFYSFLRERRDRYRQKSRDTSVREKLGSVQAPPESLLDEESTRGDDRVGPWCMFNPLFS